MGEQGHDRACGHLRTTHARQGPPLDAAWASTRTLEEWLQAGGVEVLRRPQCVAADGTWELMMAVRRWWDQWRWGVGESHRESHVVTCPLLCISSHFLVFRTR